jgi:prevent-host-death family protein
MARKKEVMAAGEFKQGCLALLDRVASQGLELVITKRGRAMARLVPVESGSEREQAVLAELRGRARMLVDEESFLEPTASVAGWDLDGR